MHKALRWVVMVLASLIAAVAVLITVFDWNWARSYIASEVSERIGRKFTIQGDLGLDLFPRPHIYAGKIRLANAAWSEKPYMLKVDRLEFEIVLTELLMGHLVIPKITLNEPVLILQRSAQGRTNWGFLEEKSAEQAARGFPVNQLIVHQGHLSYLDPSWIRDMTATGITLNAVTKDGEKSLNVEAQGQLQGEQFQFTLEGGPLSDLRRDKTYPLNLTAAWADTQAQLDGTLTHPLQFEGVDLNLVLQGPDPANLMTLLGLPMPSLAPYQVEGHLSRKTEVWKLSNMEGTLGNHDLRAEVIINTREKPLSLHADLSLGESDLAGTVSMEVRDSQPFLKGNVSSNRLNFNQLADVIDTTDGNIEYLLNALQMIDARLDFQGGRVITADVQL